MRGYLGVDVGSVSTNLLTTDEQGNIIASLYIRTQGQPIAAIQEGLALLKKELPPDFQVCGAGGATGSGRTLAGVIVGADLVNEITAHAIAASRLVPNVQTVLEVGGQDSKIIILREGVVTDLP